MIQLEKLAEQWRKQAVGQLFIGIGGGSGSGKSTIARKLHDCLQPLSVCVINQDRFFKTAAAMPTYYSEFHDGPRPDFNRPDSLKKAEMVAYCQAVDAYDVVILEGILALYYPELRALMNLLCYVTIDLPTMLIRRTSRNLAAGYGGSYEEISHYNLDCITPQHQRFNAPTARHAQLLIPNEADLAEQREALLMALCLQIKSFKESNV